MTEFITIIRKDGSEKRFDITTGNDWYTYIFEHTGTEKCVVQVELTTIDGNTVELADVNPNGELDLSPWGYVYMAGTAFHVTKTMMEG